MIWGLDGVYSNERPPSGKRVLNRERLIYEFMHGAVHEYLCPGRAELDPVDSSVPLHVVGVQFGLWTMKRDAVFVPDNSGARFVQRFRSKPFALTKIPLENCMVADHIEMLRGQRAVKEAWVERRAGS